MGRYLLILSVWMPLMSLAERAPVTAEQLRQEVSLLNRSARSLSNA